MAKPKEPSEILAISQIKKHFDIVEVFGICSPQWIEKNFVSSYFKNDIVGYLEILREYKDHNTFSTTTMKYCFACICGDMRALLSSRFKVTSREAIVKNTLALKLSFILFNIYYAHPDICDHEEILYLIEELRFERVI